MNIESMELIELANRVQHQGGKVHIMNCSGNNGDSNLINKFRMKLDKIPRSTDTTETKDGNKKTFASFIILTTIKNT